MKRYKLTLIPKDYVFDTLFDDKHEAGKFVCQYVSNNPEKNLSLFDFRLDECDLVATDITNYSRAKAVLGNIVHTTIVVDPENEDTLTNLDRLLTIARAWNKVDGTTESLPHPDNERYFPQFSDDKDDEKHYFYYEYPMASEHDFGIEALISFRTKELAKEFSSTFKEYFAKLFKIPYEP